MLNDHNRPDRGTMTIYRKIKEDFKRLDKSSCLDEETLICYLENRLDEKEVEQVEKHVFFCELCSDCLVTMNKVSQMAKPEEGSQHVTKEAISKAINLVHPPKKNGEKNRISKWLSRIIPFPMPTPIAIPSALGVLLILSAILFKSSLDQNSSVEMTPGEFDVSLIARSHSRAERGGPLESSRNIINEDGGVLRSHDAFQIRIKANQDSYLYVFIHDSLGRVELLFPHPHIRQSNKFLANTDYMIPSRDEWFWLDENTGTETVYVLATNKPIQEAKAIKRILEKNGIGKVEDELGIKLLQARSITFSHIDDIDIIKDEWK